MPAIVICRVPEIDALIVFPTLGAPQILPSGPKSCTVIIATNVKGHNELSNPCKGAVLVNHHLCLIGLNADKAALCGPCDSRLYKAIEEDYYFYDKKNTKENGKMLREQYIEIDPLVFDSDDSTLYWPEKKFLWNSKKVIGRLSPEARALHGGAFSFYFAITLKNLSAITQARIEATPKSWAWIVTTNAAAGHTFLGAGGESLQENEWPGCMKPFHQPLDRLIHNKFNSLTAGYRDSNLTSSGNRMEADSLYEILVDNATYEKPQSGMPSRRVQAWHPVMTKTEVPLKFGHLTDAHISVRAASLNKARVRVIEDDKASGRHFEPVGKRVAHTYKSFKALVDEMAARSVGALALTGDLTDFNLNLDPHRVEEKPDTATLWRAFNVFANVYDPKGPYRRDIDQLYLYSLLLYALRMKKMPAFYVTGNHEGYQWPYGISPRVNINDSYWMQCKVESEIKAFEKVREAHDALLAAEIELEAARRKNASQSKIDLLQSKRDEAAIRHEDAKKEHENAAEQVKKYQNKKIEVFSEYAQQKATECLPADHNLTIYEACLAYGPTYGQILVTNLNFRREQFSWIHWLYAPFSDLNVYPGCEDLLGKGARQAITLLGWGGSERLLPSIPEAVVKYFSGSRGWAEDRRGYGFLPYAPESINEVQLKIIEAASEVKLDEKCHWSVLSHFTVASFQDGVPATISTDEAGFWPSDQPEYVAYGATFAEDRSQYNYFNWGGCERGVQTYLKKYTTFDREGSPKKGRVDLHLAGHSHRCGIYTLQKESQLTARWPFGAQYSTPVLFPSWEYNVHIECKVPRFSVSNLDKLPKSGKGTRYIVGSTAGSMGKQAVSGLNPKTGRWDNNAMGSALLGGWLTRPPSGLAVGAEEIDYVKAVEDEARNDVPRLAIMVDYRDVMGIANGTPDTRPIIICPINVEKEAIKAAVATTTLSVTPGSCDGVDFGEQYKAIGTTMESTRDANRTSFEKGLPVIVSPEIKKLDCLDLTRIKVWVFKKGAEQIQTADEGKSSATTDPAPVTKGGWEICKAWVSDATFFFEGGGQKIKEALTPKLNEKGKPVGGDKVLCAFVEVPLKEPKYPGVPWDEVKWEGESWVFPVDIERASWGNETLRRGEGESGEVPNWEFLREFCGYPNAQKTNNPNAPSSTSNKKT